MRLTQRLPSAREMEWSRTVMNIVCADGLTREVVAELQPNGEWAAGLTDDDFGRMPGSGVTMIGAIIDLITSDA